MSEDIRTDHEYQVAEFGDFGFRILTDTASVAGERFSSIMAVTDCPNLEFTSTRSGDSYGQLTLLAGMVIYGDLNVEALTGKVIAYLRA